MWLSIFRYMMKGSTVSVQNSFAPSSAAAVRAGARGHY
jgi:hypothetical protein